MTFSRYIVYQFSLLSSLSHTLYLKSLWIPLKNCFKMNFVVEIIDELLNGLTRGLKNRF